MTLCSVLYLRGVDVTSDTAGTIYWIGLKLRSIAPTYLFSRLPHFVSLYNRCTLRTASSLTHFQSTFVNEDAIFLVTKTQKVIRIRHNCSRDQERHRRRFLPKSYSSNLK